MLEAILFLSVALNIYLLIKYVLVDKSAKNDSVEDVIAEGLKHNDRSVVLMTALLALSAKIAKADGKVLPVEKEMVAKHLGFPLDKSDSSSQLFDVACDTDIPTAHFVRVIREWFPETRNRAKVVELLREIAWSDGEYHEAEEEFCDRVCREIGLQSSDI